MIFITPLQLLSKLQIKTTRGRSKTLKGSSHDGGRAKFGENLHDSPFN
jgi:hypothetical protein